MATSCLYRIFWIFSWWRRRWRMCLERWLKETNSKIPKILQKSYSNDCKTFQKITSQMVRYFWIQSRSGPGLIPAWSRSAPGLVPAWSRSGPSLVPACSRSDRIWPGLTQSAPGLVLVYPGPVWSITSIFWIGPKNSIGRNENATGNFTLCKIIQFRAKGQIVTN